MRQPERPDDADTDLRLCYTGPSPAAGVAGGVRAAVRAAGGLRLRDVGVAVRPDLAARHPAVRHARLGRGSTRPSARSTRPAWSTTTARTSAPGETGELLLRNPVVTPGYWGMPEETAAAIVDGWLHTGDLVTVERRTTPTRSCRAARRCCAGAGRTSRRPRSRTRSSAHPDVLEVAVVAVPSELTEDEVKAFVVAAAGPHARLRRAAGWTAERLSAFKVPRFWQAVDALPRTPTSRVAKHRLPTGHPPDEYDAEAAYATRDQGPPMTELPDVDRHLRRVVHPAARPRPGRRPDGPGRLRRARVLAGRDAPPDAGELRVFESVLVALADHGLTPSAIAARLTLTGAPESVQGALAAGLLGGGSRFLGVTEDAGRFLAAALAEHAGRRRELPTTDEGWDDLARDAVRAQQAAGRCVPGPRAPGAQERRPAHAGAAADRRRRRACAARTCGCSRPSGGCTPRCSAAPCRSTAPASAARPCATSASPRTSCAGSRCWPARPGCSATSPRRCAARSGMDDLRRTSTEATDVPAAERLAPGVRLDAEERVEVALGQVHVAAHRAGVARARTRAAPGCRRRTRCRPAGSRSRPARRSGPRRSPRPGSRRRCDR